MLTDMAIATALFLIGLFGLIKTDAVAKRPVTLRLLLSGPLLLGIQYGVYQVYGQRLELSGLTAISATALAALLVLANSVINLTVKPKTKATLPDVLFISLCAPFFAGILLFVYFVFRLLVGLQHGIGRL